MRGVPYKWLPFIDLEKCNGCGKCVEVCTPRCLKLINDDFVNSASMVALMKEKLTAATGVTNIITSPILRTLMWCTASAGASRC